MFQTSMVSPFTTQQQQLAALIAQQQSMYMAAAAAAQNLQATAVLEGQNRTSGNTKPVVPNPQGGHGQAWPSTNAYSLGGFFASGAENGGLSSQVSIRTILGLFLSTFVVYSLSYAFEAQIAMPNVLVGGCSFLGRKISTWQCNLPIF